MRDDTNQAIAEAIKTRLAPLRRALMGFTSDYEVGYHEGNIAALEGLADDLGLDVTP